MISAEKEFTVEFFDVDSMQIVWNGRYFDYFEMARCRLFSSLGIDYQSLFANGYLLPLAKTNAKFIRPLRFGDEAVVKATLTEWEYLIRVAFEIRNRKTGLITTKGESTQIFCNKEGENLMIVPLEIQKRIKEHIEA